MSLYMDITKQLGDFRLRVQWEAGDEVTGILGPSGCGKSMTLRCIAGIVTPDSGEIVLDGKTLFSSAKKINLPPRARRTGLLFQSYALFPHMTTEQNIGIGVQEKGKRKELVQQYMSLLKLEELAGRYPGQMSGGQQQRVALARMLAAQPSILMLDEPFSALDSPLRHQIEKEFTAALRSFQGTVLYVSHSTHEVYQYCKKTAVMGQGHLWELQETKELFEKPRTVAAARLTGWFNLSPLQQQNDGRCHASAWGVALELPTETSAEGWVGLREKGITLCHEPQGSNCFAVSNISVREMPHSTLVSVELAGVDYSKDVAALRFSCTKGEGAALAQASRQGMYLCLNPVEMLALENEKKFL